MIPCFLLPPKGWEWVDGEKLRIWCGLSQGNNWYEMRAGKRCQRTLHRERWGHGGEIQQSKQKQEELFRDIYQEMSPPPLGFEPACVWTWEHRLVIWWVFGMPVSSHVVITDKRVSANVGWVALVHPYPTSKFLVTDGFWCGKYALGSRALMADLAIPISSR